MSPKTMRWLLLFAAAWTAQGFSQDQGGTNPGQEPEEGKPEGEGGRPGNAEGYNEYFKVTEVKYIPSENPNGPQSVQLRFNLIDEIPKGCVIRLSLDFNGLSVEETKYTYKEDNRNNLGLTWKFSKKLALGEYQLRSHIDLVLSDPERNTQLPAQTPAVLKSLGSAAKVFPPRSAPWSWYSKQKVKIGNPEDEGKELEATCALYGDLMDRLIESMGAIKESMDEALKGAGLAEGGKLDQKKFADHITEWRKKQGELQKEILLLVGKEPTLIQKTQSAWRQLKLLGQMVSKRGTQLQKDVEQKYKLDAVKPSVKDFDARYNATVEARLLQNTYEGIRSILGCPEEAEEGDAAAPEAGAEGAPEATPPEEPKAEGEGGEQPAPGEEPEPEKPKEEPKPAPAKKPPAKPAGKK